MTCFIELANTSCPASCARIDTLSLEPGCNAGGAAKAAGRGRSRGSWWKMRLENRGVVCSLICL